MPKKERDEDRSKKDLIRELEELRQQVADLEVEKTGCKQAGEKLRESEESLKIALIGPALAQHCF